LIGFLLGEKADYTATNNISATPLFYASPIITARYGLNNEAIFRGNLNDLCAKLTL